VPNNRGRNINAPNINAPNINAPNINAPNINAPINNLANARICIITGPRIDLAEDLIARFKALFQNKYFESDRTQSTVAFINGVKVEAFPSHHVDTMRGLDNVKLYTTLLGIHLDIS
jgi:hypothetical protein